MTVKELYDLLDKMIPRALSADWDNDGLACLPEKSREVRRVLIALDATAPVVERAVAGGFDLLLTH
ncbi:MAG: Nif3-like dinuclear metal center hexameric protein, partial [Clostridia bacterium]|nr:Nif3-like dinuclear metal center hexameric protein [Clostridia bacterium]